MNPVYHSKLTRLVIAIVVAAALFLVACLVARIASEQGAARRQAYYHAWVSAEAPCLAAALKIPSASIDVSFVASGSPTGPTAPEVSYIVPDERDGYLLVAHFRLRTGANDKPIGIETADYRCLNLRTTSLVALNGVTQCRYRGVFLDAASFAAAVAGLRKNECPADISHRMESSSEDIAFCVPKYDPYAKYLPAEPSH